MTERVSATRKRCVALLLLLASLCAAGCSGRGVTALPQPRLQAIDHNRRGVDQENRGNREAALAQFREAFRLHGSIENFDGMVVALVNIARTHRLQGNLPSARAALNRALPLLQSSSGLASELYFENAKLYLAAGDLVAAKEWAVRAVAEEKGGDLGCRVNLVATVLLRDGAPDEAREEAGRALKLNRDHGLPGEEANSLRLLGEVDLLQGRHEEAAGHFDKALKLDKQLGHGKKIAADLRGLGAAASEKEDLATAIGFYQRALQVSLSGGDSSAASRDMAELAALYRRQGEPQLAMKMDRDRGELVRDGKKQP